MKIKLNMIACLVISLMLLIISAGIVTASNPGPAIDINKSTNGVDADTEPGPEIFVGVPIVWTYVITNTGGEELSNIVVTDDKGVTISCPKNSLTIGETMICTATGTAVPGQYANMGTVTAECTSGTVSDSDLSHYFGNEPAIMIEKSTNGYNADTAPGPNIQIGNPITWTYEVTNTGNEDLINIQVSDDKGITVTCPQDYLAVGASMICAANGVAEAGPYTNIGTVTATDVYGNIVSDNDYSHYVGVPGSEIPEFPTVAIPVMAVLAMAFLFMRRRD